MGEERGVFCSVHKLRSRLEPRSHLEKALAISQTLMCVLFSRASNALTAVIRTWQEGGSGLVAGTMHRRPESISSLSTLVSVRTDRS
ncbi:hypothetical protein LX32DRAFT_644518 [Colletotrichum zoysiae]|uniref:Uncharacterized protein n=1 Tax=Colletotrichum zoysiae TaxID=1216348 RepID=A0AAD9H6T9_9PEZI|nr:hypothetical protein LX32DRAFT_644518 [Colletotrichum zoysiae]